jgi:dihydropteroate synthase
MNAPVRSLATSGGRLEVGPQPAIMGIVNATPDSFSDQGLEQTLDARVALAAQLVAEGATVLDIGGESGVTNRPPVDAQEEIGRVVPLIERVVGELGVTVSVDTYKPAVARAAIAAGASIINDVSALRDVELADVCAVSGAALVVMHTISPPKQKVFDPGLDGRMAQEVLRVITQRIEVALEHGVSPEQIIVDPGPDFCKTPAQTIEVLRALEDLHALGHPILLAASRKDFVGAITGRPPRERLGGTLAAIAFGVDAGAHLLRVHDVAAVADFLAVRRVLRGEQTLDGQLRLSDALRWAQPASG